LLTLCYLSNIISSQRDFELKQQERREYGDSWTNPIQNRTDKEKISKAEQGNPSHQNQNEEIGNGTKES
jgi:hypothetical protein